MERFTPTRYTLTCVASGREFEDEGWTLDDPECGEPSLVRARYAERQLNVRDDAYGIYRFCDWLPDRKSVV